MAEAFQLWMSHDLAERIRHHGAETFPYECCGALLGRDSVVANAFRQVVTHPKLKSFRHRYVSP
jgi:proteasome lid subunit RPN8/RPN11